MQKPAYAAHGMYKLATYVAYCHASATGLLIIDMNLKNSLLIGKCKKSRSWAKSTPEKLALETLLRKLGPKKIHNVTNECISKVPKFQEASSNGFV